MYIVTTTRLWRQWSICALVRSSSGLRSFHRFGTLLYGDEHMFFCERSIFWRMCEFVWSSRLFPYTLWFSLRLQFLAIVRASWWLGHMSQECRTPSKLGLYQQLSAKRAGGYAVVSLWARLGSLSPYNNCLNSWSRFTFTLGIESDVLSIVNFL